MCNEIISNNFFRTNFFFKFKQKFGPFPPSQVRRYGGSLGVPRPEGPDPPSRGLPEGDWGGVRYGCPAATGGQRRASQQRCCEYFFISFLYLFTRSSTSREPIDTYF